MSTSEFVIETDPTPEQVQYLEDRLYEFNSRAAGITNGQGLAIFVRDERDGIVAGICGHTWGACCDMRQFWVEKSRRRQGLGTRLLQAAEQEARRRNCRQMILTTHSFQAPEFYTKRGFHVLAAVDNYPRGHQNLLLRKELATSQLTNRWSARVGYKVPSPNRCSRGRSAQSLCAMTKYKGSCHCGRVRFEIEAEIDHVRVCDCSVCKKRGALNHRIPKENLKLLTPWEDLVLYQWGSRTAKDFFCPTCGILPFRRPSDPTPEEIQEGSKPFDGWAVNVRCLEGVDLESIPIKSVYGSNIKHNARKVERLISE